MNSLSLTSRAGVLTGCKHWPWGTASDIEVSIKLRLSVDKPAGGAVKRVYVSSYEIVVSAFDCS